MSNTSGGDANHRFVKDPLKPQLQVEQISILNLGYKIKTPDCVMNTF